jgi:hypothetical protein
VKEVGLIIDLYQSPTQEESVLKHAVSDFFVPLIKIIRSFKSIKVSLNIPLSTLELLDNYGYKSVIEDIKNLYENDRIEIVGSPAYNPLLTEVNSKIIENEIILNEYALGSYFGAKQGFEGEPSMMIKDIDGFLPTGNIINEAVLDVLGELKYTWVLADVRCISITPKITNSLVYKYLSDLKIVVPNNEIGDLVNSFNIKSFDEIWSSINTVTNNIGDKIVLVINNDLYHIQEEVGTDFYKKKISVLDQLIENLCKENTQITSVREIIKNISGEEPLKIKDVKDLTQDRGLYSSYYYTDTELVELLKKIDRGLEEVIIADKEDVTYEDHQTLCMWKNEELGTINDNNIHNKVCFSSILYKYICLDKYVYSFMLNASENAVENSKIMLRRYMSYVRDIIKYRSDESFKNEFLPLVEKLTKLIN